MNQIQAALDFDARPRRVELVDARLIRDSGRRRAALGGDKARCDVHHRVARCDGGLNTISNGEVICPNCHRVEHEGRK